MDVALITCSDLPHVMPADTLLLTALATRGIDAQLVVWNDSAVDWSQPAVSVIRSTWDYHHHHTAFLEWAQRASQLHTLWNPFPLLRWNAHKSYLRELEERGIPIIPTLWLVQGTEANLMQLMQERGWSEVVIKPAVSASAYGTMQVKEGMEVKGQLHLAHMLSTHDMLIQPFFPAVMSSGERSLIYIDGEFTHAVLRRPVLNSDSATQTQSNLPQEKLITPQEEELQIAHKILGSLPFHTLYARIDLVHDVNGYPCVMEVELIEPDMWLEWAPIAVERFANAIAREVRKSRGKDV